MNDFYFNIHEFFDRFFSQIRRRDLAEAAVLAALALFLFSGIPAMRARERLSDKIIRLHVLANSDNPSDQNIKLHVRDAILHYTENLLKNNPKDNHDRQSAEILLRDSLPELERIGKSAAEECAFYGAVTAELKYSEFPTRVYDHFSLPAGQYLSLRVIIGQGKGQNWWCVVFPPLCADSAAVLSDNSFSPEEIRLITEDSPEFIIKFHIVEFWESIRQKLAR